MRSKSSPGQPTVRVWRRPWFRPLLGVLLLLFILFADEVVGATSAGGKISPEIDRNANQVNIVVDIKFEPRLYHQETLSELGVFSGRNREDRSQLRFRAVSQSDLEQMARFFWVDEIFPLDG